MNIETVKHSGDGYLVNGTMLVPKADGNRDYEAVKKWIDDGNIVGAEFSTADLFEQAKDVKLGDIQTDFETAESQPVVHNGETFIGGKESAESIDGYVRLMKLAGATEFNIWDINGDEHSFDSAGADALILAIGGASSVNQFEKKNRKKAVADATTIEQVNAV